VSDEPDLPAGEQRELLARLRSVVEAKDTENVVLRAELSAALDRERRLELRIAELERRLNQDSGNSGKPSSKDSIEARERRKAERRKRDNSERERRTGRKRGGQPGHKGAGLSRDPDPQERETVDPPAECSGCGVPLAGAQVAGSAWAQVWDVRILRWVTEYLLPSLLCPYCQKVTTADAPPGAHQGTISYGPGINAAAVLLSGYGNVPSERAARLIAMLLGMGVSAGFVDRASERLDEKLLAAGFDDAMQAALADEPVLGADETPVNVLACDAGPETGEEAQGAPHVLIVRPPDGKLTWLRAMSSRRAAAITAILSFFAGILITDGYTAYQQMLGPGGLAGIQQCAAHVIRRCRAVSKLGPGSLQSWAQDVIIILRQAHLACADARSRGKPPDPEVLADLREKYNEAVSFGITRNRHRDWDKGNHPGYALSSWLRSYADQVWLFTGDPAVEWTNNVSERGAKAAKRHQAVSGYWHSQTTLARWCRIRSYLDSATAHGTTPVNAVSAALAGKPWLPPLPAEDLLAA
jgi:transposase